MSKTVPREVSQETLLRVKFVAFTVSTPTSTRDDRVSMVGPLSVRFFITVPMTGYNTMSKRFDRN